MATYLLTWNPGTWDWSRDDIADFLDRHAAGECVRTTWSTGNTRRISPGDQLVWIRLGEPPRGIFATGRALSDVRAEPHWDPDRADAGDTANTVDVEFDELLHPLDGPLLSQDLLQDRFPDVPWSPAASGFTLRPDILVELYELWHAHLADHRPSRLRLVRSVEQLRESVVDFHRAFQAGHPSLIYATVNPDHWVYDPAQDAFAPSKWAAFHGLSPEAVTALQRLQKQRGTIRGFDGGRAKRCCEKLLATSFAPDDALSVQLSERFVALKGRSRDMARVRFISLGVEMAATGEPGKTTPEVDVVVDERDCNVILYGPPGTGKTFRTAERAVEIVDGVASDDRATTMERYTQLRDQGVIEFVTFHQSFSYEEFVEGIRPVVGTTGDGNDEGAGQVRYACVPGVFRRLCERARAAGPDAPQNHVLIIDEINRGNIARILGELITLIEPDKRIGARDALLTTLPYSGDRFGVPSNLHIIGTMNTADRSVAFMDTALRRRFHFIEMMPDSEVIRNLTGEEGVVDGIDLAAVLDALNQRVELLYDRDHTIGHSYFLDCLSLDDVRDAFVRRVIPLLEEYFFGDHEKICRVLACPHDSRGKARNNPAPILIAHRLEARAMLGDDDLEDGFRYRINDDFRNAAGAALRPFFKPLTAPQAIESE